MRALTVAAVLLLAGGALAHGVDTSVGGTGAVTVTFRYEDGSPIAFEPCEVRPPDGGAAFQVGRTDRLGRVVFAPDREGTWTVKVTVEDGHGAVVPVAVDAAMVAAGPAAARPQGGRLGQLFTGVCVLFGVFGAVIMVQQRRKGR